MKSAIFAILIFVTCIQGTYPLLFIPSELLHASKSFIITSHPSSSPSPSPSILTLHLVGIASVCSSGGGEYVGTGATSTAVDGNSNVYVVGSILPRFYLGGNNCIHSLTPQSPSVSSTPKPLSYTFLSSFLNSYKLLLFVNIFFFFFSSVFIF